MLTDIEAVPSFPGQIKWRPERRAEHPLAPALQVCNREVCHESRRALTLKLKHLSWSLESRTEVVLWKSKTQLYSLQEEIAG